jgi:hypothetical protein
MFEALRARVEHDAQVVVHGSESRCRAAESAVASMSWMPRAAWHVFEDWSLHPFRLACAVKRALRERKGEIGAHFLRKWLWFKQDPGLDGDRLLALEDALSRPTWSRTANSSTESRRRGRRRSVQIPAL